MNDRKFISRRAARVGNPFRTTTVDTKTPTAQLDENADEENGRRRSDVEHNDGGGWTRSEFETSVRVRLVALLRRVRDKSAC